MERRRRHLRRLRRKRSFRLLAHLLDAAPAAVLGFGADFGDIWGRFGGGDLKLRFGAQEAIWGEDMERFGAPLGGRSAGAREPHEIESAGASARFWLQAGGSSSYLVL